MRLRPRWRTTSTSVALTYCWALAGSKSKVWEGSLGALVCSEEFLSWKGIWTSDFDCRFSNESFEDRRMDVENIQSEGFHVETDRGFYIP